MPARSGLSWRFTHAIVRSPSDSVARGLRAGDTGDPDPVAFRAEHDVYVTALREAGLTVDVLEPLEDYPDSCFVEDPALCLPEGAILLRPGARTRQGEAARIRPDLERHFAKVVDLPGAGHCDGGDILMLDDELVIGLSARTDADGAEALSELLGDWGYNSRVTDTPAGVLHFKTACATLGDGIVFATRPIIDSGVFWDLKTVPVPEGEDYAANVIRVNDVVLVPDGYPATRAAIEAEGLRTVVVPTHEARKVDGGLSCLSLRFDRS